MNELTIELSEHSDKHLYEQIYDYIKREIVEGRFHKGDKLPSTRALSLFLQISRSTVSLAYDQLLAEGYLESRQGSGFYVSRIEDLYQITRREISEDVEDTHPGEKLRYVFSPTDVDMTEFPFQVWKRITRDILVDANTELFSLGDPQGDLILRESIREYLHAARGVNCEAGQIVIGAGNDCLLMILQYLLSRETVFAFEDPTYVKAYRTFADTGYDVRLVSMDESGIRVQELEASGADVAYVMPSHQYPTGVIMPIGRRSELLKWAQGKHNRYIIEDDYDSEFRYRGKPIPSLQSIDTLGKVIYMGTFSKSVAPAIRVGYMVLPKELMKRYKKESRFFSSTVSRIDQRILNEFMKSGAFERYLNRMRKVYHTKHDNLLSLLKPFEKHFTITGENAGLHILLTPKEDISEEELVKSAAKKDVRVFGMSDYHIGMHDREIEKRATILLGYAGMSSVEMRRGVEALKDAWLT